VALMKRGGGVVRREEEREWFASILGYNEIL
jgi:hypothetical protein